MSKEIKRIPILNQHGNTDHHSERSPTCKSSNSRNEQVMIRKIKHTVYFCAIVMGVMSSMAVSQSRQSPGVYSFPPDADILRIIRARVDTIAGGEDGVGIVVGIL